ncbi:flagellar hook-basal body complex protein, partial [Bacillus licheniformis]|uniref:flagellar hook-basal body complex protein n=1 Tax=Bacillus licheniformis TaxID=1402 RepID=UPI000F5F4343
TAATGMKAQQFNIDTISHNLSNVNTTGFKRVHAEFQDLFYANIRRLNQLDENRRPVNLEVGHGVMPVATKRDFRPYSFMETDNIYDMALSGDGFFSVMT